MGKTTCAAAAAVQAADGGRRVLLVSTDPAHSVRDVLSAGNHAAKARPPRPIRVPGVRGSLYAVELDADRALARWLATRRRVLRTVLGRGTYLDDDDIDRFLALALPGVDELIGLIELRRLAGTGDWDEVIVDTAPTGHTLRLLAMPATLGRIATILDDMQAKHRFLAESLGGRHRPDAADALIAEIAHESTSLTALLRDPTRCTFVWVLLPEMLALEEARDGVAALDAAGIAVAEILVNRVGAPPASPCAFCLGRARAERAALAAVGAAFPGREVGALPDLDDEPRGPGPLRRVARSMSTARRRFTARLAAPAPRSRRGRPTAPARARNPTWLDVVAPPGLRLLLVAGKGGVGKTSCAAAIALALAERAPTADVLLLSIDPAHSLGDALGLPLGDDERPLPGAPRLRVRELDAERTLASKRDRYREAVDELFTTLRGGSRFEAAFDRAVVQNLMDLAPSGLDELFGVLTVIEALAPLAGHRPRYDTVVVDAAPTGHALRLLAMPRAALEWVHALLAILLKYRKIIGLGELGMDLLQIARDLKQLGTLLSDPAQSRLVAVARAAELPRLETQRLLVGARRLAIPLGAVLVNAVTPSGCPRCRRMAASEARALAALRAECRSPGRGRCAIIVAPRVAPPPRGVEALARWRRGWELSRETS